MKIPTFSDPQFLDASAQGGLNPAFGTVSGAIASMGNAVWDSPGLIAPEAMTVGFAGMTATIGLPSPWGLVASSGIVVKAHGTQTALDTQTYTVSFASLVPGSGSVTAFLAATITQIQQNPFPIPGPPPGHPAYNPNFTPTIGYAAGVYSVALSAVTGGIDNVNTFELFRTTLTAGQVTLSTYNTLGQFRAPDRDAWPISRLTSGGALAPSQAQLMLTFASSGVTVTLPPASGAAGLLFGFVNPLSVTGTIATTGSDLLFGGSSSASSLILSPSGSVLLWANGPSGTYEIMGFAPQELLAANNTWTGGNTFQSVTMLGNLIVSGSVAANGAIVTASNLVVSGTASINGAASIYNNVAVSGSVAASGSLATAGNLVVSGSASVFSNIVTAANFTASGFVSAGTSLNVTGTTTLFGNVIIPNNTLVEMGQLFNLAPSVSLLTVENPFGIAGQFMNSSSIPGNSISVRKDRTDGALMGFFFGTSQLGAITTDSASVFYTTVSDYRLKTVHGGADAGALIDSVPVHDATLLTAPQNRRPMFLAHELQEFAPWAVQGEKDAVDEKGNSRSANGRCLHIDPCPVGRDTFSPSATCCGRAYGEATWGVTKPLHICCARFEAAGKLLNT